MRIIENLWRRGIFNRLIDCLSAIVERMDQPDVGILNSDH